MNSGFLNSICSELAAESAVNPFNLYCQITGRVIGQLDWAEIDMVIHSCGTLDPDDIKSELLTRTLASMRPSPAWNFMRLDTLERMRQVDPYQVLAYLLNRLYDPVKYDRLKQPFDSKSGILIQRIKLWQHLQLITSDELLNEASVDRLLLVLLELDSKFNFNALPIDKSICEIYEVTSPETLIDFCESLEAWRDKLVEAKIKQDQASRVEANWSKGNRITGEAYLKTWLRVTPPSESKKKDTAKKEKANFFDSLLDDLMSDAPAKVEPPRVIKSTQVKRTGTATVFKGGLFKKRPVEGI